MGNLFGKKRTDNNNNSSRNNNAKSAAAKVTDKDRAVLDLKNARDRLKKFRKKLETDSTKLQSDARELVRLKQQSRALLCLKLRKYKEKELDSVDAQLLSVFKMIEDIEWESANLEVMKALKAGTEALNKIHEEMSVEDVEALLEETNEAIEVENTINNLLAGQLTALEDEELLDELNTIMEGMGISLEEEPVAAKEAKPTAISAADLDLPEVPTSILLPIAPTLAPEIATVEVLVPERVAVPG